MKKRINYKVALIAIAIVAIFGFSFSGLEFVFAQEGPTLDVGLEEVGQETGLGVTDPRIIVGRIIRYFLGFLGVIALALAMYGGWLYMTAGGEAEKVTKAKKLLISAIIGLVIILSAFSIVSFIIQGLVDATGYTQPGTGDGDDDYLITGDKVLTAKIVPNKEVPIYNFSVKITFNYPIDQASVNNLEDYITVEKKLPGGDKEVVQGTIEMGLGNKLAKFIPTQTCDDCRGNNCFDKNTEYTVTITPNVITALELDKNGFPLKLKCPVIGACYVEFTTGDKCDLAAPRITVQDPRFNASVCQGFPMDVGVFGVDDAGLATMMWELDGVEDPETIDDYDPNGLESLDDNPLSYTYYDIWDGSTTAELGSHYVTGAAIDLADNINYKRQRFNVVEGQCCNADGSINCEAPSPPCPRCSGPCESDEDCVGVCVGGYCQLWPTITNVVPAQGAPGNLVSIVGYGFGLFDRDKSKVFFDCYGDDTGSCVEAELGCDAGLAWNTDQIVIKVPESSCTKEKACQMIDCERVECDLVECEAGSDGCPFGQRLEDGCSEDGTKLEADCDFPDAEEKYEPGCNDEGMKTVECQEGEAGCSCQTVVSGPLKIVTRSEDYDDTRNDRGWVGDFVVDPSLVNPGVCAVVEQKCQDCLDCRKDNCFAECYTSVESENCQSCQQTSCANRCKGDLATRISCAQGEVTQLVDLIGKGFGNTKTDNDNIYFGQTKAVLASGSSWSDIRITNSRIPNLDYGFVNIVLSQGERCLIENCTGTFDCEVVECSMVDCEDGEEGCENGFKYEDGCNEDGTKLEDGCNESGQVTKSCNDNKGAVGCTCTYGSTCTEGEDNCVCQDIMTNPYRFRILPTQEMPVIRSINPDPAPAKQLVTISGLNFGNVVGRVEFNDGTETYLAELGCGDGSWRDLEVVVRVPEELFIQPGADPNTKNISVKIITSNSLETEPFSYTINNARPGPGLCVLSPNNGPTNTSVEVRGEGFSENQANYNIYFAADKPVEEADETFVNLFDYDYSWTDKLITGAHVPNDAVTGNVFMRATDGSNVVSNSVNFRVGSCTDDSCLDGEICCSSGICRTEEVGCADSLKEVKEAEFAWVVSTGPLPKIPRVLERSCVKEYNLSGSPSPYRWAMDACPNGLISATFNLQMDWNSFNQENDEYKIVVKRCTETGSDDNGLPKCNLDECFDQDCAMAGVAGDDLMKRENNLDLTCTKDGTICQPGDEGCECYLGDVVSMFLINFNNNITAYSGNVIEVDPGTDGRNDLYRNTWYQVEILGGNNGVKSAGDDAYNLPATYKWRFKTQNDDCIPDSLMINPGKGLIDELLGLESYLVTGLYQCQFIEMKDESWLWSIRRHPEKAEFVGYGDIDGDPAGIDLRNDVGVYQINQDNIDFTTMSVKSNLGFELETPRNDLVRIMTQAVIDSEQEENSTTVSLSKEADLEIKFAEPRVTDYYPKCETACINAQIGAKFNTRMQRDSFKADANNDQYVDNLRLYPCFAKECVVLEDADSVVWGSDVEVGEGIPINPDDVQYIFASDSSGNVLNRLEINLDQNLEPNKYYRMVLFGDQIKSATGKTLGGLNYSRGVREGGDCNDGMDNDGDDGIDTTGGYDIHGPNDDGYLTLDYFCGCYNNTAQSFASYGRTHVDTPCSDGTEFGCRAVTVNPGSAPVLTGNLITVEGNCSDRVDNNGDEKYDFTGGYVEERTDDSVLDYICGCYNEVRGQFIDGFYGQIGQVQCQDDPDIQFACLDVATNTVTATNELFNMITTSGDRSFEYFSPDPGCDLPYDYENGDRNLQDIYDFTYHPADTFCDTFDSFEAGEDAEKDSFSWVFKTKNDPEECSVADVVVEPLRYYAEKPRFDGDSGEQIQYSSTPYSAPDECSENGQALNPFRYDWSWASSEERIATLSNTKYNPEPKPFCDSRCLTKGSLQKGAICGDGFIGDPLYELSYSGYLTAKNDGTLLAGYRTYGEECENGISNVLANGRKCPDVPTGTICKWKEELDGTRNLRFCRDFNDTSGICTDWYDNPADPTNSNCTQENDACRTAPASGDGCTDKCLMESFPVCLDPENDTNCCGNGQKEIYRNEDLGRYVSFQEECDQGCSWQNASGDDCRPGEEPAMVQCNDNIDNDGDGFTDYPDDPDCTSPTDNENCTCVSLGVACTNGCLNAGTAPGFTCGNNIIEAGEDCDDGNTQNGDGCNNRCLNEGAVFQKINNQTPPICGNNVVEPQAGEECEPSQNQLCTDKCVWQGFPACDPSARVCEEDPNEPCTESIYLDLNADDDFDDPGDIKCTCNVIRDTLPGSACCGNGIYDSYARFCQEIPDRACDSSWTLDLNADDDFDDANERCTCLAPSGGSEDEECEAICRKEDCQNEDCSCSWQEDDCVCELPAWCSNKCLLLGSNIEYDSICGDGFLDNGEDAECEEAGGGTKGSPYQIATIEANILDLMNEDNVCYGQGCDGLFQYITQTLMTQGLTRISARTAQEGAPETAPAEDVFTGLADLYYQTDLCMLPKPNIDFGLTVPEKNSTDICRNAMMRITMDRLIQKDQITENNILLYKVLTPGERCPVAVEEPVMMWNFNENQGTIANESLSGNNGTVNAGVWADEGFNESALVFNGETSYVYAENVGFDPTRDWSISAWIKKDIDSGSDNTIFAVTDGEYRLRVSSSTPYVAYSEPEASEVKVSSGASITENTWWHLLFTYDSANNKIAFYHNGVKRGEEDLTISGFADEVNITIGAERLANSFINYFDGLIDEVEVYSEYVDRDEAWQVFNKNIEQKGLNHGLIAHWPMEYVDSQDPYFVEDVYLDNLDGEFKHRYSESSPPWTALAEAKAGNLALKLDFNSYVELPEDILNNVQDFTYVGWVKWQAGTDGDENFQRIFDFGSDQVDANGNPISYMYLTPKIGGEQKSRFKFKKSDTECVVQGPMLQIGRWQHVAAILSANTISLWLDGEKVGESSCVIDPKDINGNLNTFGKSKFEDDANFNGYLDDIRIYNRALEVSEINELIRLSNTVDVQYQEPEPEPEEPDEPAEPDGPTCATAYNYCTNQADCETYGHHWYSNRCNLNPEPTCADHHRYCDNQTECEANGYYWYNNNCDDKPEPELIAHWPMDGSGSDGIKDVVRGKFDAQGDFCGFGWSSELSTKEPRRITPKFAELEGDYIKLDGNILKDINDFTFLGWAHVYNLEGQLINERIFDFGRDEDHYMSLTPFSPNGNVRFELKDGDDVCIVESSGAISQNQWHHYVVTKEDDRVRIYVDGIRMASKKCAPDISPADIAGSENYFGVAKSVDLTKSCDNLRYEIFHGWLDEFKFYKGALNLGDIIDIKKSDLELNVSFLDKVWQKIIYAKERVVALVQDYLIKPVIAQISHYTNPPVVEVENDLRIYATVEPDELADTFESAGYGRAITDSLCQVDINYKVEENADGNSVINIVPDGVLDADRNYFVVLNGVKNACGKTGNGVLAFKTGDEICSLNNVWVDPSNSFLTKANEFSEEEFTAYAMHNDQPIFGLDGIYDWKWSWSSDDTSLANVDRQISEISDDPNNAAISTFAKNGQTFINARATIDDDNIYNESGAWTRGYGLIDIFICNNNWEPTIPERLSQELSPWPADKETHLKQNSYNIGLYYCRDYGQPVSKTCYDGRPCDNKNDCTGIGDERCQTEWVCADGVTACECAFNTFGEQYESCDDPICLGIGSGKCQLLGLHDDLPKLKINQGVILDLDIEERHGIYFDNDGDWVRVPSESLLNSGFDMSDEDQSWTAEAWVFNDILPGDKYRRIFYKNLKTDGSDSYQLYIIKSGNSRRIGFQIDNADGKIYRVSSDTLDLGFNHVALVYNGLYDNNPARVSLYINGRLQTLSSSNSADNYIGDTDLYLGSRGEIVDTSFGGYIDDIRLWKVARDYSDSEIVNQRFRTIQTNEPDLIGYWKFDDSLNDYSNYGNHGVARCTSDEDVNTPINCLGSEFRYFNLSTIAEEAGYEDISQDQLNTTNQGELNQCNDYIDNDGDGLTDYDDPKCECEEDVCTDGWEEPRLLAQYFFPRTSDGSDPQYDYSPDAISLRIYENPEALPPDLWYNKYAPNPGSTSPTEVECLDYEDARYCYVGAKDGSSLYIGAGNLNTSGQILYTNIYLLGYNANANAATQNIYKQMLDTIKFNLNLDSDQASYLQKIVSRKDIRRIQDISRIIEYIDDYKIGNRGMVPQLESGTYVRNEVYSVWPSWQQVFAVDLENSLPIDPDNHFKYTKPVSVSDAGSEAEPCTDSNDIFSGDLYCKLDNGKQLQCVEPGQACSECPGPDYDRFTCYSSKDINFSNVYELNPKDHSLYHYRASGEEIYDLDFRLEGKQMNYYDLIKVLPMRCNGTGEVCSVDSDCTRDGINYSCEMISQW